MTGPTRRAFQAEMALKYCGGSPLLAETIFGWGRHTVEVGLAERRTGNRVPRGAIGLQRSQTLGRHAARGPPQPCPGWRATPTSPNVSTTLAYTRLTAKAALEALKAQGYGTDQWPSPSTMAEVLNRMGFRRRKVVKAKPQKKIAETDAIFENIEKKTKRRPRITSNV